MRGTVTTTVLLASLLMPGPLILLSMPSRAFAQDDELVGRPPEEEPPPARGPTRLGDPPPADSRLAPEQAPLPDATTPPSQMDEVEREARFKALTQEAALAYENGDLDHAVEAFEKAYAVRPVANILYNLGRIHEARDDLDEAIANYHSFVTSPGIDQGPREDALARIRALREVQALKREAELDEPEEQQAQTSDDGSVEESRVDADDHAGGEAGSPPAVEGDVEATKVVARSEAIRGQETDYTLTYVLLGTSGASLVGAGVFALLASGAHTDAEDASTLQARRDAADSGETYALVADGLLLTGLVTGALGGLTWWWASSAAAEASAVRVGPQLGADRVGVRVRWDY